MLSPNKKSFVNCLLVCFLVVMMNVVGYAADGPFVIKNDRLEFPDGSSVATAPRDGKSILNGSGAPGILTAQPGDFYLDTQNSRLYGPYSGSWGSGVSLVGPQGPQGTTGATGPQGPAGSCTGNCGGSPTLLSYMTYNWNSGVISNGTTDLSQIVSFYSYPNGGIYGYNSNLGFRFTADGKVVYYFLQYLDSGFVDQNFPLTPIAGGRWWYTTINGQAALQVDASAVHYAMPDVYFTAYNGNLVLGDIVPSPAVALPQTALFSTAMISGKSIIVDSPSGKMRLTFSSGGTASGIDSNGKAVSGSWSITADGLLDIAATIKLKIVGGAGNSLLVTYTNAKYLASTTELGPINLQIY